MKRPYDLSSAALSALFCGAALGDGGFFLRGDQTRLAQAADLAQTRQEVVLAFYDDAQRTPYVTYVLRGRYAGKPEEFAWIIPTPATPTRVVAHDNDDLFEMLDEFTRPEFTIYRELPIPPLWWFTCGAPAGFGGSAGVETTGDLVQVEAQGQAGIFDWAALTSTGSTALRQWLNDNGFAVPPEADDVLEGYIEQDMHFLAVRINEPAALDPSAGDEIEIPPIQFTCQTARRLYPMAISQVSAAEQTEVLIYVLAERRAQAANVPNGLIDPDALRYDPDSLSLTNYESVFADTIADLGGVALITEAAWEQSSWFDQPWVDARFWPDAPMEALRLTYLTRMRTVVARERMTTDFEFEDAAPEESVERDFFIDGERPVSAAASFVGQPLAGALMLAVLRVCMRRRARGRP